MNLLLKFVIWGMLSFLFVLFFFFGSMLILIPKKMLLLISRGAIQCRVLLCLWHVRRSWIRSLLKKCCNLDVQREMFKHLGQILYCTKNRPTIMDAIQEFMQIFVDQCAFMNYFKRRWLPRIGIFLIIQLYFHRKWAFAWSSLPYLSSS